MKKVDAKTCRGSTVIEKKIEKNPAKTFSFKKTDRKTPAHSCAETVYTKTCVAEVCREPLRVAWDTVCVENCRPTAFLYRLQLSYKKVSAMALKLQRWRETLKI